MGRRLRVYKGMTNDFADTSIMLGLYGRGLRVNRYGLRTMSKTDGTRILCLVCHVCGEAGRDVKKA